MLDILKRKRAYLSFCLCLVLLFFGKSVLTFKCFWVFETELCSKEGKKELRGEKGQRVIYKGSYPRFVGFVRMVTSIDRQGGELKKGCLAKRKLVVVSALLPLNVVMPPHPFCLTKYT